MSHNPPRTTKGNTQQSIELRVKELVTKKHPSDKEISAVFASLDSKLFHGENTPSVDLSSHSPQCLFALLGKLGALLRSEELQANFCSTTLRVVGEGWEGGDALVLQILPWKFSQVPNSAERLRVLQRLLRRAAGPTRAQALRVIVKEIETDLPHRGGHPLLLRLRLTLLSLLGRAQESSPCSPEDGELVVKVGMEVLEVWRAYGNRASQRPVVSAAVGAVSSAASHVPLVLLPALLRVVLPFARPPSLPLLEDSEDAESDSDRSQESDRWARVRAQVLTLVGVLGKVHPKATAGLWEQEWGEPLLEGLRDGAGPVRQAGVSAAGSLLVAGKTLWRAALPPAAPRGWNAYAEKLAQWLRALLVLLLPLFSLDPFPPSRLPLLGAVGALLRYAPLHRIAPEERAAALQRVSECLTGDEAEVLAALQTLKSALTHPQHLLPLFPPHPPLAGPLGKTRHHSSPAVRAESWKVIQLILQSLPEGAWDLWAHVEGEVERVLGDSQDSVVAQGVLTLQQFALTFGGTAPPLFWSRLTAWLLPLGRSRNPSVRVGVWGALGVLGTHWEEGRESAVAALLQAAHHGTPADIMAALKALRTCLAAGNAMGRGNILGPLSTLSQLAEGSLGHSHAGVRVSGAAFTAELFALGGEWGGSWGGIGELLLGTVGGREGYEGLRAVGLWALYAPPSVVKGLGSGLWEALGQSLRSPLPKVRWNGCRAIERALSQPSNQFLWEHVWAPLREAVEDSHCKVRVAALQAVSRGAPLGTMESWEALWEAVRRVVGTPEPPNGAAGRYREALAHGALEAATVLLNLFTPSDLWEPWEVAELLAVGWASLDQRKSFEAAVERISRKENV